MFSALGICGISHVPFFWKPPQGLVVFPWIQKIMASQAGCCTPQADWSQSCQRHHSHHSPAFLDPLPLIPSIPAEWKTARVCPNGKYRIFGWSDGYWHGTAVSSRCVKAPIHRPFSSKVVTSALPLKGKWRQGECVYGVNSFKTPESLTNSRKPSEKDWARAEPRLGCLLLGALKDRESHIHFCLNEVSDPPSPIVTHLPPRGFMHSEALRFQFNMKRTDLTPNISLQFIPGASFTDSVLN